MTDILIFSNNCNWVHVAKGSIRLSSIDYVQDTCTEEDFSLKLVLGDRSYVPIIFDTEANYLMGKAALQAILDQNPGDNGHYHRVTVTEETTHITRNGVKYALIGGKMMRQTNVDKSKWEYEPMAIEQDLIEISPGPADRYKVIQLRDGGNQLVYFR